MSVRRTFTCDGPDCEAHVNTAGERPPTFLTIHEEPGYPHERRGELHFCSWDCVLKHGAGIEPSERIDQGGPADA